MLLISQQAKLFEQGKVPAPFPTYVASYRKWQELGRQVQRGQIGMAINCADARLPPGCSRQGRHESAPGPRRDRQPDEREVKTGFLRGFTVEKVFSAEQTDGDPLPAPPQPRLLEGQAPPGLVGIGAAADRIPGVHGLTVPTADDLQGANGRITWATKTVQIRADMDDAAMVKSLPHEAAHSVFAPVSQSGLSLTDQVAPRIFALHPRPPILCGDGDTAGQRATAAWAQRAIRAYHREVLTLSLPDGLDPAEWLAHHGTPGC